MCNRIEEIEMLGFVTQVRGKTKREMKSLMNRAKQKLSNQVPQVPLEELYANEALYKFDNVSALVEATKTSFSEVMPLPST